MNAQLKEHSIDSPSIINGSPEAHSKLKCFMDKYNAEIKDAKSRGEKLHPLQRKINSNERATADNMLRIYLKQLHKLNQVNPLSINEIPGFRTFTPSLANLRDCTEKTIQNHRKKLKEAGVLIAEENHGGNGLRIWFNPQIILKPGVEKYFQNTNQSESLTEDSPLESNKTKNLHPLLQDLQDQKNNISHVDMCKGVHSNRMPEPSACDKQDHYRTKEQDAGKLGNEANLKIIYSSRASRKNDKRDNQRHSGDEWKRFSKELVEEFWIHAKHKVYPQEKFADQDLKVIKNMIWRNVFNGVSRDISKEQWKEYLQNCKERLSWARNWAENHPDYIIPPPHFYFGPTKKVGTFYQTWDWYVNSQREKEWNIIFAEAKKFRKGKLQFTRKGNRYTPTVHEVYRRHSERLKRYGDQKLIDRLNAHTSESLNFYLGYKPSRGLLKHEFNTENNASLKPKSLMST